MKKLKPLKNAHTSNSKIGMGDFYGTGVKAKTGKMKVDSINMPSFSPKKLKTPPKSLA